MSQFLTTDELADLLRVNRKAIYKLVKNGLPCLKLARDYRFDYQKVMEYLENASKSA